MTSCREISLLVDSESPIDKMLAKHVPECLATLHLLKLNIGGNAEGERRHI